MKLEIHISYWDKKEKKIILPNDEPNLLINKEGQIFVQRNTFTMDDIELTERYEPIMVNVKKE